ncbi:MAG: HDOD domain-containing protein [Candidatus Latescibacteria bacterium]|nr:HDOD domain-containing protein [Candidatus Latescibacterota bacterium]
MDELEAKKDRVRQHLERANNLPTLPVVIARVIGMVDSPQTSSRQLGDEIAKDQVLTAKVLKLVNSGFYGFSRPISTITHAVTMLGFDAVKGLVLSCSALEDMEEALPGLWEHSLACAAPAGLLPSSWDWMRLRNSASAACYTIWARWCSSRVLQRSSTMCGRWLKPATCSFIRRRSRCLGRITAWPAAGFWRNGPCLASWWPRSATTTISARTAATPNAPRWYTWPTCCVAPRRWAGAGTARFPNSSRRR